MRFLVRTLWLTVLFLLISQGFLQCFYPGMLQRIRDRFGRTLE